LDGRALSAGPGHAARSPDRARSAGTNDWRRCSACVPASLPVFVGGRIAPTKGKELALERGEKG